jgi:hypothetical protein
LCPTDGKTTNPGLPKALAGQADLKTLFLHKVLSKDIRLIRWSFFNPLEKSGPISGTQLFSLPEKLAYDFLEVFAKNALNFCSMFSLLHFGQRGLCLSCSLILSTSMNSWPQSLQ